MNIKEFYYLTRARIRDIAFRQTTVSSKLDRPIKRSEPINTSPHQTFLMRQNYFYQSLIEFLISVRPSRLYIVIRGPHRRYNDHRVPYFLLLSSLRSV